MTTLSSLVAINLTLRVHAMTLAPPPRSSSARRERQAEYVVAAEDDNGDNHPHLLERSSSQLESQHEPLASQTTLPQPDAQPLGTDTGLVVKDLSVLEEQLANNSFMQSDLDCIATLPSNIALMASIKPSDRPQDATLASPVQVNKHNASNALYPSADTPQGAVEPAVGLRPAVTPAPKEATGCPQPS